MKLYFLRHGPALSREEWTGDDDLRPLSEHGVSVIREVARHMARLRLGIEVALTSPCERALRTALLVCEEIPSIRCVEDARLGPGTFGPGVLAAILEPYSEQESLLLVGHDPSMTTAIAGLMGGGRLDLKKGGLLRIDLDPASPSTGVLRWYATPSLLGCG
ncbi:MAG: hypothetical protein EG823_04130 [Actinobacteria bacterium]|nr:hypothetical protein [Actinomycetota bacterium]